MNVVEIAQRVEAIRATGEDDAESAHCDEDALHRDVLRAIAEGRAINPRACAAEALRTYDFDFPRWYA